MFKSVSLKSTINHIVCDFNVNGSHVEQDDDYNWTDLVQKCIEGRQHKVYDQIPELSISESETSLVPPENLFEESEIGRDANFSTNDNQILLPEPALLATPRSSFQFQQKDLPVTLIEEIENSPPARFSRASRTSSRRSSSSTIRATPLEKNVSKNLSNSSHSTPYIPATATEEDGMPPVSPNTFSVHEEVENSPPARFSRASRASSRRPSSSTIRATPTTEKNTRQPYNSSCSTPHVPDIITDEDELMPPVSPNTFSVHEEVENSPPARFSRASRASSRRSSSSTIRATPTTEKNTSQPSNSSCSAPHVPDIIADEDELMPPVSPNSSFSAHSSPIRSPTSSIASSPRVMSPTHSNTPPSPVHTKSKKTKTEKKRYVPARFLTGTRLQTWRGQHPIYVPQPNGCYEVVGITKPHTPDHLKRKRIIRKTKPKKIMAPEQEKEQPALTTSFVDKSETTRDKFKYIFMDSQTLNWKKSKFDNKITHATLARNKETSQIVGYIRFSGKCTKPTQKSDHLTIFVLVKGSVTFKVGDNPPVVIKEADPVSVPALMPYSIENLLDSEAIILFTLF